MMPNPAPGIEGRPLPMEEDKKESPATKAGGSPATSRSAGKGSSASGENASTSGDNVMEQSLDIRDGGSEWKDLSSSRKRRCDGIVVEGEVSHMETNGVSAESSYAGGEQSAKFLSVSESDWALLPSPETDLNIGMALLSACHVGTVPSADECEVRRETVKQMNRKAAKTKRPRLQKQQKSKDLARRMAELNNENSEIRVENERIKKMNEELITIIRRMVQEFEDLARRTVELKKMTEELEAES